MRRSVDAWIFFLALSWRWRSVVTAPSWRGAQLRRRSVVGAELSGADLSGAHLIGHPVLHQHSTGTQEKNDLPIRFFATKGLTMHHKMRMGRLLHGGLQQVLDTIHEWRAHTSLVHIPYTDKRPYVCIRTQSIQYISNTSASLYLWFPKGQMTHLLVVPPNSDCVWMCFWGRKGASALSASMLSCEEKIKREARLYCRFEVYTPHPHISTSSIPDVALSTPSGTTTDYPDWQQLASNGRQHA